MLVGSEPHTESNMAASSTMNGAEGADVVAVNGNGKPVETVNPL